MTIPTTSTKTKVVLFGGKANELTPDLNHTFWFASLSAQATFFDSLTLRLEVTNNGVQQYVRVTENSIKVPYPKETITRYTYMSIFNYGKKTDGTVEGKRYYAFITNMEYVADNTTLITFKVDPIQTYMFDIEWQYNFVERMHSYSDIFGYSRVAEPFTCDDYLEGNFNEELGLYDMGVIIGVIEGSSIMVDVGRGSVESHDVKSHAYCNHKYYCSAEFFGFDLSNSADRTKLEDFLRQFGSSSTQAVSFENIVCFYVCPSSLITQTGARSGNLMNDITTPYNDSYNISASTIYTSQIDGHTIVNNKLKQYPFVMLEGRTNEGSQVEYKIEDFASAETAGIWFDIEGSWVNNPCISIYPRNYKGFDTTRLNNEHYGLSISTYPSCAYASDEFKRWFNEQAGSFILKDVATALVGIGTFIATGNPVAGIIAGGSVLASTAEPINASEKTPILNNASSTPMNLIEHTRYSFIFCKKTITGSKAKSIDDFFTRFGYATNELIDLDSWFSSPYRTSYNYIKTTDAHVNGNIQNEYKMEIQNILNKGITFWKSSVDICDYSVSNVAIND